MRVIVTQGCETLCPDPIVVRAGDAVVPNFGKYTEIHGWVWCTAQDGRVGWTPERWLEAGGDRWRITRDYNAFELCVAPGELLDVELEESGFLLVRRHNGASGWVPCENVGPVPD